MAIKNHDSLNARHDLRGGDLVYELVRRVNVDLLKEKIITCSFQPNWVLHRYETCWMYLSYSILKIFE